MKSSDLSSRLGTFVVHYQSGSKLIPQHRFKVTCTAKLLGLLLAVLFVVFTTRLHAAGLGGEADPDASPQYYLVMMIVYTLMAIVFSFLCSVAEAVMLSITPSYLAKLESEGAASAPLLTKLKGNIDRSLAAILTLNTIAHTVGAGGAGAQAAAYFGDQYVTISMIVLTLLILFLSEIIPKTIGAIHWRTLAPITGRFVWFLIIVLFPLILVSELLTRLLTRGKTVHGFNREEFAAMADIGAAGGHFDDRESGILSNLFRLREIRVEDIMTPRVVVRALQQDRTVHEVVQEKPELTFSRIPVYAENRDAITGFVLQTDIFLCEATEGGQRTLKELKRDIMAIDEEASLSSALDTLLDQRSHVLLVVDKHGGMQGIITLEDVLETVMGIEIVDEADKAVDMRAVARKKWRARMDKLGINVYEDTDQTVPMNPEEKPEGDA